MIRVLLVDDEPLVRERIRTLLAGHLDVEVVGESEDGLAALQAMRELKPELLLLDIQMPGLGGLEVVEAGRREGPLPLLIFITAYEKYALDAFRYHALDYLLKPLEKQLFDEALDRARVTLAGKDRTDLEVRIQALLAAQEQKQSRAPHIVVRDGDRYCLVRTAEIQCIEATGNYVTLHCGPTAFLHRETLTSLEAKLDPSRFVRTHRSWIVNVDHVQEAQAWAKGSWVLLTRGGHKVPLSAQNREALTRILG